MSQWVHPSVTIHMPEVPDCQPRVSFMPEGAAQITPCGPMVPVGARVCASDCNVVSARI